MEATYPRESGGATDLAGCVGVNQNEEGRLPAAVPPYRQKDLGDEAYRLSAVRRLRPRLLRLPCRLISLLPRLLHIPARCTRSAPPERVYGRDVEAAKWSQGEVMGNSAW